MDSFPNATERSCEFRVYQEDRLHATDMTSSYQTRCISPAIVKRILEFHHPGCAQSRRWSPCHPFGCFCREICWIFTFSQSRLYAERNSELLVPILSIAALTFSSSHDIAVGAFNCPGPFRSPP